eukprot:scaffold1671_cov120-Skeletonema_dohrnii-CCMP3373.AAC.5
MLMLLLLLLWRRLAKDMIHAMFRLVMSISTDDDMTDDRGLCGGGGQLCERRSPTSKESHLQDLALAKRIIPSVRGGVGDRGEFFLMKMQFRTKLPELLNFENCRNVTPLSHELSCLSKQYSLNNITDNIIEIN